MDNKYTQSDVLTMCEDATRVAIVIMMTGMFLRQDDVHLEFYGNGGMVAKTDNGFFFDFHGHHIYQISGIKEVTILFNQMPQ